MNTNEQAAPVDEREAFETWASDHYVLQRNVHSNTYISVPTMRAWEVWQARAELDRQGRGEPVYLLANGSTEWSEVDEATYLWWKSKGTRPIRTLFTAPQPAEPVKEVSDDDLEEIMGQFADEVGCIHDDSHAGCARALLSRYGAAQPAASAEPVPDDTLGRLYVGKATAGDQMLAWQALRTPVAAQPSVSASGQWMPC